jgi:hypothetical protein
MSYDSTQLATSALFRIRFRLQDTDINNEFLVDDEINFLIGTNSTEDLATLEAASIMLAQFAQYTREREGQIEVYGNLVFTQWKEYLEQLVKDLTTTTGIVIIGGVNATEINRVKDDIESVGNGYELDFLSNQRTFTFGTELSNTSRRRRSSQTSFKIS